MKTTPLLVALAWLCVPRGPLGGQGDTALVRQIGSRWVVCWIEPWWIS